MGVFDKIKQAIFGREAQAAEPPVGDPVPTGGPAPAPAPSGGPMPQPTVPERSAPPQQSPPSAPAPGTSAPATATAAPPAAAVDVEAIMDEAVAANGQKLDWRRSIVDMMKALGLDSSLSERKELAEELGYTGSTDDSAAMNIWLHKALMQKLAENGGRVPPNLAD